MPHDSEPTIPPASYKPASTYSPVGTVPDDQGDIERRRHEGAKADRPAETSAGAKRPGGGLALGDDEEQAAGGNRD